MLVRRLAIAVFLAASIALPVAAADLGGSGYAQCTFAEQSGLSLLPEDEIESRVGAFYDEAAAALADAAVVGSKSPAFVWASETKFQCGKAIGYLSGGTIDEVSVQKCDCFHARLQKYR